ncbi:hypothetical protein H5410_029318 [Solanum commersonii]|uniref:Uncharacterized protein n=1 Tax=Solanum commersonii TaxID=4109 RepID=A0A9J5Z5A1_SOLCO|nr:hypothetical protein H5410_029318 [Solanum commersonii]
MKQQHPELYTLSQQQQATVAMMRITEFYNSVARFNNLTKEVDRLEWNRNSKNFFCQICIQGAKCRSGEGKRLALEVDIETKNSLQKQAETINHLFLHCKWTDQLWRMFISLKGISWVIEKKDERLSRHAFGSQFGLRGTKGALRGLRTTFRILK